jgi:sec-independent protein translocase protein TatA
MNLGPTELIIILVIVLLIFGVGRVGKIGGELGSAIREFRKGLNPEEKKNEDAAKPEKSEDTAKPGKSEDTTKE